MKNTKLTFVSLFIAAFYTLNANAVTKEYTSNPVDFILMNDCSSESNSETYQPTFTSLDEVIVVEATEEIELGFDTYYYLPEHFNTHAGMSIEIEEINLLQVEEDFELGFNPEDYLPEGFNPYACFRL